MIADVHITDTALARAHGLGRPFFKIDLMKGSLEQMRAWLSEKGIEESDLLVYGFEDWGVEGVMPLEGAFLIKKVVFGYYDGDEYIVKYLLKKRVSWCDIVSDYYVFFSKDEQKVTAHLLKGYNLEKVIELFFKCGSLANFLRDCEASGILLATPKGFYVRSDYQ